MTVTVRSFAKINLGLRIGAARADGFHELLTVYQTIALHDVIRVSVGRGSGIEIQCTDPRVPTDESNTCFRMVAKAMQALRAKGRVVIEIEKRLPVQGGLGGASANAVAALLGLERALKKALPAAERFADRGGSWIGSAAVSGGWDRARRGSRGAGVSAAGLAGNGLRGGDSEGWSVDSEGVCGVGQVMWRGIMWRGVVWRGRPRPRVGAPAVEC